MADITWGDALHFIDADVNWLKCAQIDTNKYVVIYRSMVNNKGIAIVATIADKTLTWGAANEFCAEITSSLQIGVCKLDTNKFVVVYADDGEDFDFFARVGTVTDRTIAWNGATEIYNGDAEYPDCCQIDTDKFAVVYNDEDAGDHGHVLICTVADGAITPAPGGSVQFEAGKSMYNNCCPLDTDKLVVVYRDMGDLNHAKVCVITVVGTVPSPGTVQDLDATGQIAYPRVAQLDTDKFISAWPNSTAATIYAKVGTVVGTVVTLGLVATIGGNLMGANGLAAVDTTHFVIAYEDTDNLEKGTSRFCSVSGRAITLGGEEIFWNQQIHEITACLVAPNKIALAFKDDSHENDRGTGIVGDTPAPAPPTGIENKSANMGAKLMARGMI